MNGLTKIGDWEFVSNLKTGDLCWRNDTGFRLLVSHVKGKNFFTMMWLEDNGKLTTRFVEIDPDESKFFVVTSS